MLYCAAIVCIFRYSHDLAVAGLSPGLSSEKTAKWRLTLFVFVCDIVCHIVVFGSWQLLLQYIYLMFSHIHLTSKYCVLNFIRG